MPNVDTDTVYLDPGESSSYTMYFYTNDVPGEGSARMRFRNINQNNNSFSQNFICVTESIGILENIFKCNISKLELEIYVKTYFLRVI